MAAAFVFSAPAAADPPSAKLDRSVLAARGKQSAVLTASAFGRYAVTASSSQGVALQLVDRMAGSGPRFGEAGKQDGRLDLFLDRGEYKVLTHAIERGAGQATLAAHAFRELNPAAPRLIEQRLERGTLDDFEQRSYWVEITERRTVAFEAAGRHLADLRLWRDGLWLVDATPKIQGGQANPQQPLAIARLTTTLDPGLYLLSAYGGPSQPWTEASESKPFLLRFGQRTLPPEMRRQFTMGPLGVERFIVPASADFFRIELPSAEPATLQVEPFDPQRPFGSGNGHSARIDKRSLPPVAEVRRGGSDDKLVTVTTEPGKSFVLQHFDASRQRSFEGSGDAYWIASIHAGHAGDSVGASAILSRRPRNAAEELLEDRAVDLNDAWHRKFNLLEELTLFVKVPSPTVIRISGEGAKARYRLEPFITSRPRDYQSPGAKESGSLFPVLSGLYVLTVTPETKGILDLHLLPGLSMKGSTLSPVSAAVRFSEQRLDANTTYTLYLNRQPGVEAGAVIRKLPIDLRAALPVFQQAGETLTIPILVEERGTLRARPEDGKPVEIALDNGKSGIAIDVEPGRYRLTAKSAPVGRSYSLSLDPKRLDSDTPLPPMPDATLAGLPKFPLITPAAPDFLDLDRQRSATYNVRVDQPGLYQFESTGLLHTEGRVRTRVNPALFAESRNGVGGNFMVQRYLREGEYQLAVATLGETRGHLGVRLATTPVVDGGELREGEVARAQLPPGRAMAYRFRVVKRGNFRLQAMGLGRSFEVRLEDEQGWPVDLPVQPGDLTTDLEPGSYRLLVLPQTHEARVLTRLDRNLAAKRYSGHGPHRIALGAAIEHTWSESGKKRKRQPDLWEFTLPAPAEVTLSLSDEVNATLINLATPKQPAASFSAKQAWRGLLPAGRYRLEVKPAGKNNLVKYALQTASTQLLPGQSRTVPVPSLVPVSIGTDGLVEIESFGSSDVRGRLLDGAGEIVAQSDDRNGDWNFQIAQRLQPGDYRLQIDPIGEARTSTTISINVPGEVVEKPLALSKDVEIRGTSVHVFPLPLPADGNVLLVSARSGDTVGLALEGETPAGWVNLGDVVDRNPYLALPIAPAERYSAYRLRAWSADRRSRQLSLRVVAGNLAPATEARWVSGGVNAQALDAARPGLRLALISLTRPGVFRLTGELGIWRWSDTRRQATRPVRDAVLAANGATLLLAGESANNEELPGLNAERLQLPTGGQEALRIELPPGQPGVIDLQPVTGGPALLFAESRTGQPGIGLDDTRDPAAIGFVGGESVTLVMPGIAIPARLWNAAGGNQGIELDVRQINLKAGGTRSPGFGIGEGVIGPRGTQTLNLPSGALAVRLTLSPANAAVFTRNGRALSTHWAGKEMLQESVHIADADQLLLINTGAEESRYGVELSANGGGAAAVLRPGELFERNLATSGRLRIPVELPKDGAASYRLRVAGHQQALWQERGGKVTAGDDLTIGNGGSLWVQHRPGTVVAWLEDTGPADPQRAERWARSFGETKISPPQSIRLDGKQKLLGFRLDQPAMLHVRSDAPMLSQWVTGALSVRTGAHLQGAQMNLPLIGGSGQLLLRAVGADQLTGAVTVNVTPPVELRDGPGPEVLLGPGSARLFWFDLAQPATIGIGVRASADVIRAVLLDSQGIVRSEGVVQMPTLLPGRYYLSVEIPPDNAPVRVQPVVIGLARPDTRPPYEILRLYVETPEGEAPALLYVPPPPAPPPSAVAGVEAEKEVTPTDEEMPVEGDYQEQAGDMPAEGEE